MLALPTRFLAQAWLGSSRKVLCRKFAGWGSGCLGKHYPLGTLNLQLKARIHARSRETATPSQPSPDRPKSRFLGRKKFAEGSEIDYFLEL